MVFAKVALPKLTGFVETYRGEALAWETDELGHMNMRYYFARAAEARALFFTKLQLGRVYKHEAFSTLVIARQHVKYHKEVRPGQGIVVHTGVVSVENDSMVLVHVITNPAAKRGEIWQAGDYLGGLSATIVETVKHVARRTNESFAWPSRALALTGDYMVEMPKIAQARNIDFEAILADPNDEPSVAKADALDLPCIGQGMFQMDECDVFGHVLTHNMVGRISNSVQHLIQAWPDIDFASESDITGALLEACAQYCRWPKAGDCFVIRSGLRSVNSHTSELCHWILDPVTGKCWGSFLGVACRFNMKTRKLVKLDEETLALVQKSVTQNIRP
ncbi:MAG: hypothetical protein COA43_07320 [Robiginitomaculum sp.]|nr:MAG: hypothetical protein COA43_07320 [Robiginitomaculum sp.]